MAEPNPSGPVAIGEAAPSFQGLLGVDGKAYSLSSFDDKELLVLLFMANRCTTVQAYVGRLLAIQDDYRDRGVQMIAINSDDEEQLPTEGYLEMIEVARERGYNFPYLKDEGGWIAKAYGAQLTLHAFLLDRDRKLRYRGRVDNSPNPAFVTVNDLRIALDDVLAGRDVHVPDTMPHPCGIDKYVSCPTCGSRLEFDPGAADQHAHH